MLSWFARWVPAVRGHRAQTVDKPRGGSIDDEQSPPIRPIVILTAADFDNNAKLWRPAHTNMPMLVLFVTNQVFDETIRTWLDDVNADFGHLLTVGVFHSATRGSLASTIVRIFAVDHGWSAAIEIVRPGMPTSDEIATFISSSVVLMPTRQEKSPRSCTATDIVDGMFVLTADDFVDAKLFRTQHTKRPMLVAYTHASCINCVSLKPVLKQVAEAVAGQFDVGVIDTTNELPRIQREHILKFFPTLKVFYPHKKEWAEKTIDVYPRTKETIVRALREH